MGRLHVLSRHGDETVEWDTRRAASSGLEAAAAIREAERIFREHRARGAAAFKVERGEPAVRLDVFDPEAEEVIVIPQVAGG